MMRIKQFGRNLQTVGQSYHAHCGFHFSFGVADNAPRTVPRVPYKPKRTGFVETRPKIGFFGHLGSGNFQGSFADFGIRRSRLRNEDDGGQRRRLRKNDAAPRDGLGGQTSTVELLRRIRRQKRWRMRAGRPERACGADLVRCALSCSASTRFRGPVRGRALQTSSELYYGSA